MNNTCFASPSEMLFHIYGRTPPVQALGRLEAEMRFMWRGFMDDIDVVGKLLMEAEEKGTDIDLKHGFSASLANWVMGFSNINPLPPHYFCPVCKKAVFMTDGDGWDLPRVQCCGRPLIRDGHKIPIESARSFLEGSDNGLYIRIAPSFIENAMAIIREHYMKHFTVVHYSVEPKDSDYEYVLIPKGTVLPKLDENGVWQTNLDELYRPGYRTIILLPSHKKERLRELKETTGASPNLNNLLEKNVLSTAEKQIRAAIQEQNGILLKPDELSFSSLLKSYGYLHSTHAEDNPVFFKGDAKVSDVFTCREEVWDLVRAAMKPEYGLGSEIADTIMSAVRKGKFARKRMDPETELLLREIGISEQWITQMKYTWYLPPKADLMNGLLDEMKLAWYELQAST